MAKTEITGYQYDFRNMSSENIAFVYLMHKDKLISMAAFIDNDEQELPPPREHLNGVVHVSYRYKWLSDIIGMLRNEEPVYFIWHRTDQNAVITTEKEPIGEEEHKSFLKQLFG